MPVAEEDAGVKEEGETDPDLLVAYPLLAYVAPDLILPSPDVYSPLVEVL
jgi:hypothetical protein